MTFPKAIRITFTATIAFAAAAQGGSFGAKILRRILLAFALISWGPNGQSGASEDGATQEIRADQMLGNTRLDLNAETTTAKAFLIRVAGSRQARALRHATANTTDPFFIVYEGAETSVDYPKGWTPWSGPANLRMVPKRTDKRFRASVVGGTIEDAIAKPLAASTRDLATTTVGNILLVQELSLVDQTSWSPNWAVDELQEQALTVAESEELLRTKYRFDAGPNPPDMLVLCIECPRDEIIAAQSSKPVTVRELVLELLRRSRRKIYDLAPLEQPNVVQISLGTLAPDGYYRFSVGVVSSAR